MSLSEVGKLTLIYLLSRMDKASSGSIEFNGKDICKMTNNELSVFRKKL